MKKITLRILAVILALVSVALICYPFISNYLMSIKQETEIVTYEEEAKKVSSEEKNLEYIKARKYNASFVSKVIITDPFDPNFVQPEDIEYESVLNMGGTGIMGTLEIPVIDVKLPIYHGTSDKVLEKGVGHMQNTSLPIGGKGTHSVLTGHTGLPSARLFTDINQLKLGDMFFIKVYDDIFAYEVCKTYIIEPSDTESLKIYPEKDYVSLLTCTPYGINSHRLIVRGKRVPYVAEKYEDAKNKPSDIESTWMKEYKKALITGAIILLTILVTFGVVRLIIKIRNKKKQTKKDNIE